jgi:hypothetical protein
LTTMAYDGVRAHAVHSGKVLDSLCSWLCNRVVGDGE